MKRITTILIAFICIIFMSVSAYAVEDVAVVSAAIDTPTAENASIAAEAEAYNNTDLPRLADGTPGKGNIESPSDYWGENGYPDDVSYAFEAGGEMAGDDVTILHWWEIGLINATDERRAEITAMFSDTCIITFHDAQYSYNERVAVLNEIEMQVKEDKDANYVQGMLINNSDKVYIVVKDAAYEEYNAIYSENYGDMVQTARESEQAYADISTGMVAGLGIEEEKTNIAMWLVPVLVCLLFVAVATVFFVRRKQLIPAMQTTAGNVVTAEKPLSRAETVSAVRENEYTPKNNVLDEIKRKL